MTSDQPTGRDQRIAANTPGEEVRLEGNRRYVRGEAGLAVFRPQWEQTGHILTHWEAREAYGQPVIDEAMEYGSAILRATPTSTQDALRTRREDLGLSARTVGQVANLSADQVCLAEDKPSKVSIRDLERIAFALGLDERFIAFKSDCGGDRDLGVRLKVLSQETGRTIRVNEHNVAIVSEAASVIRTQHRLQTWLRLSSGLDSFSKSPDYGSPQSPAWSVGYRLARSARAILGLGEAPIPSMRELVEKRLGIPVIQAVMNRSIAGATVANTDENGKEVRGIILNLEGDNENVWVRRATLAHELAHLLYDPNDGLEKVRVDLYQNNQQNVETYATTDYVEQRANAFAIAFLAPIEAMRQLAPTPVRAEDVEAVMSTFGISRTAAGYHIDNCHYRQFSIPEPSYDIRPADEQTAAENFATDYFPLAGTPEQRRGKFAGLVAAAYERDYISEHTAALYLNGEAAEFMSVSDSLRDLFDL
ncbi:MAG: XRE family transcriptional regulator [Chloroflexota bacterium]|nr:XRE family transcriptional regulator [Chloroflexota bacterium]